MLASAKAVRRRGPFVTSWEGKDREVSPVQEAGIEEWGQMRLEERGLGARERLLLREMN